MDPRTIHDILSGDSKAPGAAALRAITRIASVPYAGWMRLRRKLYRIGVPKSCFASVPVICVGNLTTGGTGKTPMVRWVVDQLRQAGCNPAILTRGYRAVDGISDEAELLRQLTGSAVIVNPDRVQGAEQAIADGADVLVMDDGYQHLRLRRDMNIVLLDAAEPFGYGYCLPRGLLREPVSALHDAQAIVLTRSDRATREQLDALHQRVAKIAPDAPVCEASHHPASITDVCGKQIETTDLAGRKIFAFCGIANPESFFATLADIGARLCGSVAFEDHVQYDAEVLERLAAQADTAGASVLITTEKDAVKLQASPSEKPLWTLKIEIQITRGEEQLADQIRSVIQNR